MKKKTYSRLKIVALGFLLVEAMMLLVLLLAQTGASAEISGNFGPSHKGTPPPTGHSDQGTTGAADDPYTNKYASGACGQACGHRGEAADILDTQDGDFANGPAPYTQDGEFANGPTPFTGGGTGGGQGRGGDNSRLPGGPPLGGGPSFSLPGFSGRGGSPGGKDSPGGNDFGTNDIGGPGVAGEVADGPDNSSSDFLVPADDTRAGDGAKDGAPDGQPGSSNPIITTSLAPIAVPEPLTVSLFVTGLAATLILRRRKRALALTHCVGRLARGGAESMQMRIGGAKSGGLAAAADQ
jgi:hypothetical protein